MTREAALLGVQTVDCLCGGNTGGGPLAGHVVRFLRRSLASGPAQSSGAQPRFGGTRTESEADEVLDRFVDAIESAAPR